jgi:sirohydrochlorin cobaltochelatase
MTRGVILFGHGSRDPAWRQPMDAVAARIAARQPDVTVVCAFLELQQPSLEAAADSLVASGVQAVQVLPMFLGVGRHAREDMPLLVQQVKAKHPALKVAVSPSVGEEPRLLDLLADLALRTEA